MIILLAFAFSIALTSNPPGYSIPPATIMAGELGKFPMMKQGPIRDGLMKDGCAYVYGDVDNSKVTGPCISMAAGEGSSIQIKSSHRGDVFMFRVKNIEDHSWSEWKVLSIKG